MIKKFNSAFTIVELLVVIVVIGVLAAITILSYAGITNRANLASMQSDLSNASKQLGIFYTEYNYYPATINCSLPDDNTNKCIKASANNSFTYTPLPGSNPASYTLSVSNLSDSKTKYIITNDSSTPMKGAPLGPVADWLAVPQGDHYGNFYDLVANQYATVSRSSPKTIYNPSSNKIYDVPANYIGIRPRSDGGSGYEAEIEESRTNYLLNSYFEGDSNNDGQADSWGSAGNITGLATFRTMEKSVYGKSQGLSYIAQSGDSNRFKTLSQQSATGTFAAGDSATLSGYLKGSSSGVTIRQLMRCYDSSGTYIASIGSPYFITLTDTWTKYQFSWTNLPTNTSRVQGEFVTVESIDYGDSFDILASAVQLEKGSFDTSYIPTTTTIQTRAADDITVPADVWRNNLGTTFTSSSRYAQSSGTGYLWAWGSASSNDRIYSYLQSGYYSQFNVAVAGVYNGAGTVSAASDYRTYAGRWGTNMYNVNFIDNATNATSSAIQTAYSSNLNSVVSLGSNAYGGGYRNGSIQRLVVYNRALGSGNGEITTVFNAVKAGP